MISILLFIIVPLSKRVLQKVIPSFIVALMRSHRGRNLYVFALILPPFKRILPFGEVALDIGTHLCHPLVSRLFLGDSFQSHLVLSLQLLHSFGLLGFRSFILP